MRFFIRHGKQHILRLYIHMDNTVPSALVGRWLVGAIGAIAESVGHGVKDMPQKRFRKNEATRTLVKDYENMPDFGWGQYRCVWYQDIKSQKSP